MRAAGWVLCTLTLGTLAAGVMLGIAGGAAALGALCLAGAALVGLSVAMEDGTMAKRRPSPYASVGRGEQQSHVVYAVLWYPAGGGGLASHQDFDPGWNAIPEDQRQNEEFQLGHARRLARMLEADGAVGVRLTSYQVVVRQRTHDGCLNAVDMQRQEMLDRLREGVPEQRAEKEV